MAEKTIKSIDQDSVHSLTSGQVVVDLQTAVKELLENALDAGATSVELIFKNYGIESFEVRDNGKGIDPSDWSGIALKHHTSKLTQFSDLTSVETLGFRGEALSSLCGTATLSLVTSTALTAPKGTTLTFARNGDCEIGSTVARAKGTTVIVKDLFISLPVRRKELERNASKEFKRALSLIQSYALIRTGCRFSVSNHLQGKAKMELLTPASVTIRSNFAAIFTGKTSPLIDMDLVLSVEADKSVLKWSEPGTARMTEVRVKGLVSKPASDGGRSSNDRQFFYINGRPFLPPKIAKSFNEVFKNYNTGSYPVVVADFQLAPDAYDVNVSPDKRTIFLHSEANLILALKEKLEQLFQPFRGSYAMNPIGPTKNVKAKIDKTTLAISRSPPPVMPPNPFNSPPKRKRSNSNPSSPKSMEEEILEETRKKSKSNSIEPRSLSRNSSISSTTPHSSQSSIDHARADEMEIALNESDNEISTPLLGDLLSSAEINSSPRSSFPGPIPKLKQTTLDTSGTSWAKKLESVQKKSNRDTVVAGKVLKRVTNHLEQFRNGNEGIEIQEEEQDVIEVEVEDTFSDPPSEVLIDETELEDIELQEQDNESSFGDDRLVHLQDLETNVSSLSRSFRDEMASAEMLEQGDITVAVDIDSITADWTGPVRSASVTATRRDGNNPLKGAAVDKKEGSGEVLSRIVKKADFGKMEIIGQFNLGFIIARRKVEIEVEGEKETQDDLFIVDQHASDEIYNFEQLQAKTVIQSQRLISPRELNLPSQDEMTAMENAETLRINGYETMIDEDAEVGKRVFLISLPVSKKTVFGVDGMFLTLHVRLMGIEIGTDGIELDFEELLDLITNSAAGEIVRPSKVRRMFASRACRMSVMIGTALSQSQMTNIVRHMGTMDQPWACPHGRPTALWLAGLNDQQTPIDTRSDLGSIISLYQAEKSPELET